MVSDSTSASPDYACILTEDWHHRSSLCAVFRAGRWSGTSGTLTSTCSPRTSARGEFSVPSYFPHSFLVSTRPILSQRGPRPASAQALLLPSHGPDSRRPHRKAPPLQPYAMLLVFLPTTLTFSHSKREEARHRQDLDCALHCCTCTSPLMHALLRYLTGCVGHILRYVHLASLSPHPPLLDIMKPS